MLVVTDATLVRVDRHYLEIEHSDPPSMMARTVGEGPMEKNCVIEKELIKGEQFVTGIGERIVLGLSKEVRKALGIPLKEVQNLRKRNTELRDDLRRNSSILRRLANQLDIYKSLSIWGRLKFLFNGDI